MRTWLDGQSLKIATYERLFNPYVKPPLVFREPGRDELPSTIVRFTSPARLRVPHGSVGRALAAPRVPPGVWSAAEDGEQVVEPPAAAGCLRSSSSASILDSLRDGRQLHQRPARSSSTGLLGDMKQQFKALKDDIAALNMQVDEALQPAPAGRVTFSNIVESADAAPEAQPQQVLKQPRASAASSSSSSTGTSSRWCELFMTQ